MTGLLKQSKTLIQLIAALALTGIHSLSAQSTGIAMDGSWPHEIAVSDISGRPFENHDADVEGSPYFIPSFKKAILILSSGRIFSNISTRIDLARHTVDVITDKARQLTVSPGQIKEIRYMDTLAANGLPIIFRSGFPAPDKSDSNQYFQLLADGKYPLLKLTKKSIAENKNPISGNMSREYETREVLYVFKDNNLIRLQKNIKFLVSLYPDKKVELENFIQAGKINLKDEYQIITTFFFLNAL